MQTLAITPPQCSLALQFAGQVPPQPSGPPHTPAQLGTQPHWSGKPGSPPQVCGAWQLSGHWL
jgi:hypothetical protein